MHSFSRLTGSLSAALALSLCGLSSCASDGPAAPVQEDGSLVLPITYTRAWVGSYEGVGEGVVQGVAARFDPARLTIALDADSVKKERCHLCVTVTLDTLFALTNVSLWDPVSLTLEYREGGRARTLILGRFSGGGATGNVLQARLLGRPVSGEGPATDVSYLLERR